MATPRILKRDLFGTVSWVPADHGPGHVVRELATARWWTRPLARWLARREARALASLHEASDVPTLLRWDGARLVRTWLPGLPLHVARTRDPAYFRDALALLRRLHRAGVAHGDLAKEPNWLVLDDGRPAVVDFQLATVSRRRGCWFRTRAREDVRHLLKHKRSYCPERLTARQRRMLATPAWPSRVWMATGKRVYLFVTRRLLGWADREGAGDRGFSRRG